MKYDWRTKGRGRNNRRVHGYVRPQFLLSPPVKHAFTLIEVLVVLALIAAVTGLLVIDFAGMPDRWASPSDYEAVHSAVESARVAAQTGRVKLDYSAELCALRVSVGANEVATFPVKGRVHFSLPPDEAGTAPINLDSLAFSAEGGATPALLSLECENRVSVFRLEPFSCALSEENP